MDQHVDPPMDQRVPSCSAADPCAAPSTACVTVACVDGSCVFTNAPAGRMCTDQGGTWCDGAGACVVAPECGDGATNGDELCDPTDPLTPCCSLQCDGPALEGSVCGEDQNLTPCDAAPTCSGTWFTPTHCVIQTDPDGSPCAGDNQFCNGVETCQSGTCTSPGNPCVNSPSSCQDACDEIRDNCAGYDPVGQACTVSCRSGAQCNGVGVCTGGTFTC